MTIGRIALLFCAAIWCACAAFALAALVGRARRAMRRYGVSARVVFLLAAAACVMLAGGKSGSVSVLDAYIQDAGSYLTNDVAHVALSKKTPSLPDSTEILVYARELSSTNAADWFRLSPHLTYADHPYDYALPNATNYSVLVSSSFVPEPTVHTNGVWALRGFEIPGHPGKYAFGNSRVRTIVTASDYVQDGLIAMWDGIENAGWGVHDANATTWVDLIGNRDWTLGPATSYEWTANSFDAKDQNAATQDFMSGSLVDTVEICAKTKYRGTPSINVAFVIIGRSTSATSGSYFGLLYRNQFASMMSCFGFYANTYSRFNGLKTSFSFPSIRSTSGSFAYFNGTRVNSNGYNTLDYIEQQRGSVARIGGIATAALPVEVFNIRVYSRALTEDEILHNYEIDRIRFKLP